MKLKTRPMEKGRSSIIVPILIVLTIVVISGISWLKLAEHEENISGENKISIYCIVVADQPKSPGTYELRDGVPTTVGIYRFYRREPKEHWTGTFELLDTIQLQEIGENIYFGMGVVNKLGEEVEDPRDPLGLSPIDNALTIGYPMGSRWGDLNWIDGKATVKIDQSKMEAVVLVHYWETWLRWD